MAQTPETLRLYLSAEEIQKLVNALGERISTDYSPLVKPGSELLIVVTLKGAIFFAADLVRRLTVPVQVDFVRLSSYGTGVQSSGTVRISKDIEFSPQGRHVLILDEIIDTGHTMAFLLSRLRVAGPKSLKVCTLLNKPGHREEQVPIDYSGINVENKFLVGYGLDYNEKYRNLKDIYSMEETTK